MGTTRCPTLCLWGLNCNGVSFQCGISISMPYRGDKECFIFPALNVWRRPAARIYECLEKCVPAFGVVACRQEPVMIANNGIRAAAIDDDRAGHALCGRRGASLSGPWRV